MKRHNAPDSERDTTTSLPPRPPDSSTEWLAVAAGIFILAPGTGTVAVGALSVWLWPDNAVIQTTAASTATAALAAMLGVLLVALYLRRTDGRLPRFR